MATPAPIVKWLLSKFALIGGSDEGADGREPEMWTARLSFCLLGCEVASSLPYCPAFFI